MRRPDLVARRLLLVVGGACLLLLLLVAATSLEGATPQSDAEREEFLRQARIVSTSATAVGVTAPLRATLSDGDVAHAAHVQTVDIFRKRFQTPTRTIYNFQDSYKFNIAAYRLDRLLGLNMVPVSVERTYHGDKAAVTWWIDDVQMMDSERHERGIQPPDLLGWNDQMQQARIFTQLIHNSDPNLGNFLITTNWRLWMVDFTRSFHTFRKLPEPELIERIDRRVYDGLRALSLEALRRATAPYLTRPQMKAVMARRDAILGILDARIEAQGKAAVVCEAPGH